METLKRKALESCRFRGHEMGAWFPVDFRSATATCRKCARTVMCQWHPAPNEIAIGGEAVALTCDG